MFNVKGNKNLQNQKEVHASQTYAGGNVKLSVFREYKIALDTVDFKHGKKRLKLLITPREQMHKEWEKVLFLTNEKEHLWPMIKPPN